MNEVNRGKRKTSIHIKAQHMRKLEDTDHDLIEVTKYGSKIFIEQDIYARGGRRKEK